MNNQKVKLLEEALLAQGIADAFGYLVEFKKVPEIMRVYGPNGLQFSMMDRLSLVATDDTQMSLFCLQGMINHELNPTQKNNPMKDVFPEFQAWLTTQGHGDNYKSKLSEYPELFHQRAPGGTCLTALGSKKFGTIDKKINDSKGCGGIMRTLPVAFFAKSLEQAFFWGAEQAALTHGHPSGYLSSGFYTAVAYQLIEDSAISIEDACLKTLPVLEAYDDHEEVFAIVQKTLKLIKEQPELESVYLNQELGGGWVGEESLAFALYIAAIYTEYPDVLEVGSNHNGDSDSTAMLAAGLWHLKNRKPEQFMDLIDKIDLTNVIQKTVSQLNSLDAENNLVKSNLKL